MAQKMTQKSRTVYKADIDEMLKFAALINSGGYSKNKMTEATEMLLRCVYAQKGAERRKINHDEVTKLIAKGYSLTE